MKPQQPTVYGEVLPPVSGSGAYATSTVRLACDHFLFLPRWKEVKGHQWVGSLQTQYSYATCHFPLLRPEEGGLKDQRNHVSPIRVSIQQDILLTIWCSQLTPRGEFYLLNSRWWQTCTCFIPQLNSDKHWPALSVCSLWELTRSQVQAWGRPFYGENSLTHINIHNVACIYQFFYVGKHCRLKFLRHRHGLSAIYPRKWL